MSLTWLNTGGVAVDELALHGRTVTTQRQLPSLPSHSRHLTSHSPSTPTDTPAGRPKDATVRGDFRELFAWEPDHGGEAESDGSRDGVGSGHNVAPLPRPMAFQPPPSGVGAAPQLPLTPGSEACARLVVRASRDTRHVVAVAVWLCGCVAVWLLLWLWLWLWLGLYLTCWLLVG